MASRRLQLLRNVIGGGENWTSTLLLPLAFLTIAACTEDYPAGTDPTDIVNTRAAADSTAAGDAAAVSPAVTLSADTAWADVFDETF